MLPAPPATRRRANGYFIYGTVDGVSFQPKDVPVGPVRLQLVRAEFVAAAAAMCCTCVDSCMGLKAAAVTAATATV